MAKEYHLVKALPSLARLSELVSTSTRFRVLGGFDFEAAAIEREKKKKSIGGLGDLEEVLEI